MTNNLSTQMFSDLNNIKSFAVNLHEELENQNIKVEHGDIEIIINGNQKIKSLKIGGIDDEKMRLATEEAIQKSQKLAAESISKISQTTS